MLHFQKMNYFLNPQQHEHGKLHSKQLHDVDDALTDREAPDQFRAYKQTLVLSSLVGDNLFEKKNCYKNNIVTHILSQRYNFVGFDLSIY